MGAEELGIEMEAQTLRRLTPNSSRDEQIYMINEIVDILNASSQTQILADSSTKRMLFGFQESGWGDGKDFGIKVSREGVDVTRATNDELLFSMDLFTWRWFDPDGRNFVNVGLRSTGTHGFEMAKPTEDLDDPT